MAGDSAEPIGSPMTDKDEPFRFAKCHGCLFSDSQSWDVTFDLTYSSTGSIRLACSDLPVTTKTMELNNVYLSKIFDWFEGDFERGGQTVIDFVRPFVSDKDRGFLGRYADDLNTKYMGYDWTLNGR